MSQKVKMHAKNVDNQYVQVYPETVASQVIVEATGQTLEQMVNSGNLGGGGGVAKTYFIATATVNGQNEFVFEDANFNLQLHNTMVHLNGEFLHKGEEYTIERDAGQMPRVVLTQGVSIGDKIHVTVEKGGSGGSGNGFEDPKTVEILEHVASRSLTARNFYVNNVSGNDANDGLTPETAFKTLKHAGSMLSNCLEIVGTVTVIVAAGTYHNDHFVSSYRGSLALTTDGGEVVLSTVPSSTLPYESLVYINGASAMVIAGITIKPNSSLLNSSKALYPLYVAGVSDLYVDQSVTIDCSDVDLSKTLHDKTYGVNVNASSTGQIRATFKNIDIAASVGQGSSISFYQAYFENCGVIHNIGGSVVSSFSQRYGSKFPPVETERGGLHAELVNNGIIVESGSNENGKYTKFANGLAVCTINNAGGNLVPHSKDAAMMKVFYASLPITLIDRVTSVSSYLPIYGANSPSFANHTNFTMVENSRLIIEVRKIDVELEKIGPFSATIIGYWK